MALRAFWSILFCTILFLVFKADNTSKITKKELKPNSLGTKTEKRWKKTGRPINCKVQRKHWLCREKKKVFSSADSKKKSNEIIPKLKGKEENKKKNKILGKKNKWKKSRKKIKLVKSPKLQRKKYKETSVLTKFSNKKKKGAKRKKLKKVVNKNKRKHDGPILAKNPFRILHDHSTNATKEMTLSNKNVTRQSQSDQNATQPRAKEEMHAPQNPISHIDSRYPGVKEKLLSDLTHIGQVEREFRSFESHLNATASLIERIKKFDNLRTSDAKAVHKELYSIDKIVKEIAKLEHEISGTILTKEKDIKRRVRRMRAMLIRFKKSVLKREGEKSGGDGSPVEVETVLHVQETNGTLRTQIRFREVEVLKAYLISVNAEIHKLAVSLAAIKKKLQHH